MNDGVNTMLEALKISAEKFKDLDFLGTRDDNAQGRPYKFRTYGQVEEIA